MAFKKLASRVGAGAVLIPAVLVIAYLGGLVFAGFVALVAALAGNEFVTLSLAGGFRLSRTAVVAGSAAVALAFHFGSLALAGVVLTLVLLSLLVERLARSGVGEYAAGVALSAAGVLYTGWLPGFFILLRRLPGGAPAWEACAPGGTGWTLVAMALVLAWASDSGAYFVGSALGAHKLMPRVSPSKTVEGAVGGIACPVAAALACRAAFAGFISVPEAVLAGLVTGAACVAGDLVESMLKRSTGVKDSSRLIPGHGGLLDRFDSLLFAGPLFYLFVRLAVTGVSP